VPLTRIQSEILRLLAAHRDPESDVAGSTPLNVDAPRYSGDIDIFHDREERVAQAAQADGAVLLAGGFGLDWFRREPTPEGLINEVRRVGRYTAEEFRHVASDPPIDPAATMTRLREILEEADAFVARMPTEKAGLLFLQAGKVVQPDPDRIERYQTHAGQRRGHWPSSPEISAAMLERYGRPAP